MLCPNAGGVGGQDLEEDPMSIDPDITPDVPDTPDDPEQEEPEPDTGPGVDAPVPATEPLTKPH